MVPLGASVPSVEGTQEIAASLIIREGGCVAGRGTPSRAQNWALV